MVGFADDVEESGAEPAGDGEVGGDGGEFWFEAADGVVAAGELSGVFGPDGHESAHIINGGAGAEGERNDIEVGLAGGVDTCLVDSVEGDDIVGEESLRGVIIVGCLGGAVDISAGGKTGGASGSGRRGCPQDKATAGNLWW